ncbi:soluble NSF attachment protein [Sporodiniella umbellata]|nr:soluble NSF attachment protein [Sporodiniella umbellata]
MASYELQAKNNIKEAQKKLNSWNFPFMGSLGNSKYEEAAEYYEKAGNMYKLAQQWKNAGDAFVEAAQLFQRGNSAKFEGSRAYDNAAKSYKRTDPKAAISALNEAVRLDQEGGNFRSAARHFQDIAELYETELSQPSDAYTSYQSAADLYLADDSPAIANKCLLKVAQIAAELEDYSNAIQKYEQVAAASVDDPLLKWSLKEHFFRAGLCHLCTDDVVKTNQALASYCNMDVSFEATREHILLKGLTECVEQGDIERFTTLVYDYDKLTRLDAWKTAVLLKIKKAIDCEDLR